MSEVETTTVNPWDIRLIGNLPKGRDVRRQMRRLDTEGQIEPLVAYRDTRGHWCVSNDDWPCAIAQVWAARLLRSGLTPESNFRFTFAYSRNTDGPEWTLMLTTERN